MKIKKKLREKKEAIFELLFFHNYFPKKEDILSKVTDFRLTMAAVR